MFRKVSLALVAFATLGAAALAPTSASARILYGGWGGLYDTWYSWSPAYYYYPTFTYADSIAHCARRFRSYDPATGTFLANDGFRHRCW
jgi:hypothetical protein